jgi:hypothetical protein
MKRNLAILFCSTLAVGVALGVAFLQAAVYHAAGEFDQLTERSVAFELKRAHLEEENARIELAVRKRWNAGVKSEGNMVEGEGPAV